MKRIDVVKKGDGWLGQRGGATVRGTKAPTKEEAVRQTIDVAKNLRANAPLRGPIVMDTPFGRLDPKHTANVVNTLPGYGRTGDLLVQEGEIDRGAVREILGTHLQREFQLEKRTARRTLGYRGSLRARPSRGRQG